MKKILDSILILLFALFLTMAHIGLFNILPTPLNTLNITFLVLILLIVFNGSGKIVWFSFILHFFMDIYSISPFGVYIISGTLSILFLYWLHKGFFTNQSLLSVFAITLTGLVIFRILYIVLMSFVADILIYNLFIKFAWELLFTMLGTIISYFLITTFSKKFTSSFL
ncbi:hypothetical protein C0581_02095 [Candidatus Parcubacteria bacterium]|nr:MAG: hypothetical protein C0581_02095 [Candidatus Parcubacteria bacterium]